MDAVREVTTRKTVTTRYAGVGTPKHKAGDWLKIYCGRDEGHAFVVKGVRFNLDRDTFEYLRDATWCQEWLAENTVTSNHRSGHYDSQGYCDNPGRGY